jgi:hypothetical protein
MRSRLRRPTTSAAIPISSECAGHQEVQGRIRAAMTRGLQTREKGNDARPGCWALLVVRTIVAPTGNSFRRIERPAVDVRRPPHSSMVASANATPSRCRSNSGADLRARLDARLESSRVAILPPGQWPMSVSCRNTVFQAPFLFRQFPRSYAPGPRHDFSDPTAIDD